METQSFMRFQICCVAVAEIKSIQISFLENSQCHFCLDSAVDLDAKKTKTYFSKLVLRQTILPCGAVLQKKCK